MSDTLTPLQKAANMVAEAELSSLREIEKSALEFQKKLTAVEEGLGLPDGFRSDARRLAGQFRAQMAYTVSELTGIITQLDPPKPE